MSDTPEGPPGGVRIRLIAVDLDGTLLRSDSTLSPEGGQALAEAASRGITVVLTTTRNLSSVRRFAAEIGIRHPVVCTNGAHILATPAGPTWVYRQIPPDLAGALTAEADRSGWALITTVHSGDLGPQSAPWRDSHRAEEITVYRQGKGQLLGWTQRNRWVVASNVEALEYGNPIRILNYQSEAIPEIAGFCAQNFPGKYHLEIYRFPDERLKSIGIFAAGSDKGAGLKEVMSRLEVGPEATMAIGDNPNDLPMFRCAAIRVAMGNAVKEVRDAATSIAPSNDEGGVAWAVRHLALGER